MFIRACRKRRFKSKIGDSIGEELTGGMLLTRSLILRGLLRQHVLAPNEKIVGVLIPPSTGGVVTNMALALDRRVAVHLNYTLSEKLINECIKIAEVKHVLTTRKVMEKFKFNLQADVFYLDDLKAKVTPTMKAAALFQAYAWPRALLEMRLGLRDVPPDELLTVIFTSGSTGVPKGVMLSQRNIASNVESIGQVICLKSQDTLIGVLPFFHSFGYTVCLWGAMALDVRGAYHFSPLEATQVGKLARTFKGTVLLGTPTFLRTYLRKCTRDDFATVNTVVAGAEKLPAELAVAFDHRFGVRPVEGYGTTELSPLVSVNVPPSRVEKNYQPDSKEGSVGRPIPNVAAKVVDVDDPTRELGPNQSGMLWIKGPNVMLGYMHRPELTKEAIVDGWYCTGDVAVIDDAGFITLTGRMSRFSKIGGEMIPHIQIEEVLTSLLNDPDSDVQKVAVTAVPDAKKGERLIVLYTQLNVPPGELCQRLRESGLPNLFVPSEDSFVKVDAIPILGSGKLDLKRMKEVALQATGQAGKG
jgi:acyl-[acyl-carrier-protein]-phospholipid O-acyltransferase/long-chain-fatty-acid--[acyl-carrier-protein] ligase